MDLESPTSHQQSRLNSASSIFPSLHTNKQQHIYQKDRRAEKEILGHSCRPTRQSHRLDICLICFGILPPLQIITTSLHTHPPAARLEKDKLEDVVEDEPLTRGVLGELEGLGEAKRALLVVDLSGVLDDKTPVFHLHICDLQ